MSSSKPNWRLAPENAEGDEIGRVWASDNQQWWNWYMSLAVDEGGPRKLVEAPTLPELPPPSSRELHAQLGAPYSITPVQQASFRRDSYAKIPAMLEPAGLLALRAELEMLLEQRVSGAAGLAFPSLELVWQYHEMTRAYVLSRRLAKAAAELLGVPAVRLYHDNVLSKNPGCGRTPWHYDAHHYPIDSDQVVTAWFPLQSVPVDMGPLVFAKGMGIYRELERLPFDKHGDDYDRAIIAHLSKVGAILEGGGYDLGDVSFHHAFSLHSAGPNSFERARLAIAITYFVDGARLLAAPTMISGDYEKFMPGVGPGQPINSPLNPRLYSGDRS